MKARVLALYLPQFHPIAENDAWWGRGFTEWTNVGKAKPYFKDHYQPRVPADLGYYDLRVPETRQAQVDMAREYGIEGFVYWHYWFGNGKRLLERPFNEVLSGGKPDFPFALAWANESWWGIAHGLKTREPLIEQHYGGVEDYTAHFYEVLPAFRDPRYITVDGRPLFMIYKPVVDPEVKTFISVWRALATENGLNGIYFVGHQNEAEVTTQDVLALDVDAVNTIRLTRYLPRNPSFFTRMRYLFDKKIRRIPVSYPYRKMVEEFLDEKEDALENVFPSIVSGWDHTPRTGRRGLVLTGFTPDVFARHVRKAVAMVAHKQPEHRIIMLKSWNEWAEGNYVEPDRKWGRGFLEAIRKEIVEG